MNQETWDAAVARIAELEAENERLRELMTNRPTTLSAWDNAILDRAERAEAENKALRDKLAELTQVADAHSERVEAELAALKPLERFQHGVTTCPACHAIMRWEQGEVVEWRTP